MPSRRNQIALTAAEQRAYLEESHTIILTSLDRRGYPHSIAMWYVLDPDGTVAMTTFQKSQKVKNLERDPRCALLVESGRTYPELKGLLIRGRATLDGDVDHVLDVLEHINAKYHQGSGPGVREALRGQASKRVVIRVPAERVASWDHEKLGLGVY
jgi:PPOX class probable F420-dependent enzyme